MANFSLGIYRSGKNSFKSSGLANLGNTVDVNEVDGAVAVSVSSKKNGKLASSLCKKNTRRTIQAAGAVAASKRPDLKVCSFCSKIKKRKTDQILGTWPSVPSL